MKPRTQMRFLFVLSGLLALSTVGALVTGQQAGAIIPGVFAVALYFGGMFYRNRWLREESIAQKDDERP